ncbi:MAG: hypothetical protein ACO3EH_00480 [Ilumatobacteraceae bacterium]
MPTPQGWLADTQATVVDGMNRGREPELISEQQAHMLRNVSIRGGRVRSRPRIVRRATLPDGFMQGACVFRANGKVIVGLHGRIYELDTATWERAELTGADINSFKQPRIWTCETSGSLVIQDNQSRPFIYDGAKFRRAAKDEVPIGGAMAYANGRLAVASGTGVQLGDIRQTEHQSELKFTETNNLLGGGEFSFGTPVRSLAALPVIDTGSGQGALIVGCDNAVFTLKTQITQRDLWSEVGFQTVLLPTRGITGANAAVAVNQDLYFRSSDGLRSVRTSTADYNAPGLAPLSVEVRHRFDYDTPSLLQDASVVLFDNRLLCTHSPFVYMGRALYQGIVAFNFDGLSGRGQKSPPAFDGEWDGVVIAQIFSGLVKGTERCFILGRDIAGANSLFEVLPETADQVGDEPAQVFESRTLFGDSPGTLKNLRRCDVQFSDIRGGIAVRVYFKPAKYPYWVKWDEFSVNAPPQQQWGRVVAQNRTLLSTRSPIEDVDPSTGRLISCSTGFQVRVEWDGLARLDYLQLFQERVSMLPYADNPAASQQTDVVTVPSWAESPAFWYAQPVSPLAGT